MGIKVISILFDTTEITKINTEFNDCTYIDDFGESTGSLTTGGKSPIYFKSNSLNRDLQKKYRVIGGMIKELRNLRAGLSQFMTEPITKDTEIKERNEEE